jgi:hypothetical protein
MKKFLFGLVLGLIVGLIGALAYIQLSDKGELDDKTVVLSTGQKRKKKTVEGLDGARIRLRTWLDGKPSERILNAHLDFLDGAIFDRQWASVCIVSKSLRSLNLESAPKALQDKPIVPSPAVKAPSLAMLDFRLKQQSFWTDLLQHQNEASKIAKEKSGEALLAAFQKLLRNPPANDNDKALRQDSLFLIGRFGGSAGLKSLVNATLSSTDIEDQTSAILAIGRSGHTSSFAHLAKLSSDLKSEYLQILAIASMQNVEELIRGRQGPCEVMTEIMEDTRKEPRIRVEAARLITHIDLKGATTLHDKLVKILNNNSETESLRFAVVQALNNNVRKNLHMPQLLIRALEKVAKTDRDNDVRCETLKALGYAGDSQSLKALLDAEATITSNACRKALELSKARLIRRFGQN